MVPVPWLCPLVAWLVTLLTGRKVLRWVRQSAAGVVVSTYPLATLCLGRLRTTGRLRIPAVNFITDFGVHPLWVHRGIDLNLAVHDGPAAMAARRTGRPSVACGPVVSEVFDPQLLPDRDRARAGLGLTPTDRAVLVVAGSWGVGGVGATWHAITRDDRFTPVVVCGRDERLRREVTALADRCATNSIILGWTEDMPALMAGCDALVENAGGLTSLEAMRAGLPVVSFQPIAGHGRENTARMAAAGVSRLASDPDDLIDALGTLTAAGPARSAQVDAGRAMFRTSAAALTVAAAASSVAEPARLSRRPALHAGRAAAAIILVAALGWVGLTSGVEVAAASVGAGVAHPAAGASTVAYVGVRLNGMELADRTIWADLERLNLTAIVDRATALTEPQAVRALGGLGINVASGGQGNWPSANGHDSDPALWTRAHDDAQAGQALEQLVGAPVTALVPGRRVNAWDLIDCGAAHSLAGCAQPCRGRRPRRHRCGSHPPDGPSDLRHRWARRHPGAAQYRPGPPGRRLGAGAPVCGAVQHPRVTAGPSQPGGTAGRVAAGLAAGAAGGVVVHLLPGVVAWRSMRCRLLPRLSGVGNPTHVALTFDDGPDPRSTPPILDALDNLGWRATFFCLGSQVRRAPGLTQELIQRGHEVAVHGDSHRSHLRRPLHLRGTRCHPGS